MRRASTTYWRFAQPKPTLLTGESERVKAKVRAERDVSEVGPPSTVEVESVPRIVLYAADGTPLVRQIGFRK